MKELKLYQCEICGTEYRDKEEAQKCEKHHIKKLKVVECEYYEMERFPVRITVETEEGEVMEYRL